MNARAYAVPRLPPDEPLKDCPYCGETILAKAVKCRYCGEMLGEGTTARRSTKQRGVYIILGLLLGGIGAHNIYAGHYARGVGQIALCAASLLLPFLFIALGIWVLIDLLTVVKDGFGQVMSL